MYTILLIEDNADLSQEITKYLTAQKYQVILAETLQSAIDSIDKSIDLALLDIHLPDGSGIDILELLKQNHIKTIITTVKNDETFIVNALDCGADDYMIKPFSLAVLRARIDLALREQLIQFDSGLKFKHYILSYDSRSIQHNGQLLDLSAREYDLLALFIKHPHRIFTRAYLLEKFWDINENYVNDNTLTVTIKRIRQKIEGESIVTVRGIGYRLG